MIRRLGIVVLVTALIVSACGRQVTPSKGDYGITSGQMSVTYRVAGTFNFSQYNYEIVFNTTGNNITPLPNGQNTNYAGYSFAIVVSGSGGTATAQAYQYFRPTNSAQAPVLYPITATASQLNVTQSSNGQSNQFTVTFQRIIFDGLVGTTPTPTTVATATATTSPSPTPTATASASASPSGSPSAAPVNCTSPAPNSTLPAECWKFNFFVTQPLNTGAGYPSVPVTVDSLGTGGPNDISFQSATLDTSSQFSITVNYLAGNHPSDPNADVQGGQISNIP